MLCAQVPVTACGPVMEHVVKNLTQKSLSNTPCTTTAAQMAYEIGMLSSLQVATKLMSDSSQVCLSWDATSIDGSHINEIHVTTEAEHLALDVKRIPGGTAADYTEHINASFAALASVFSKFFHADEAQVLSTLKNKVSCTLTDRAPVNSCVVRNLRDSMDSDLLELHCNVHPLDTFARKAKAALSAFDDNVSTSKCLGREGCAANLVQCISKLRYKAGTGDPEGFKNFLRANNLPLGTFVRYVGNRLHVLMHSSGIIICHLNKVVEFLEHNCTAGLLRTSVLHDLKEPLIVEQLWALGVIGKTISGPWMREFYASKKSNLDMVSVLNTSKDQLEKWEKNVEEMSRLQKDVFGCPIDREDPVCAALLNFPCASSNLRAEILKALITAVLSVFDTQLSRYTGDGELAHLSKGKKELGRNAPVHNMQSERALALLDGLWRRAPNATPGFLSGKIQCRLNKTLHWLQKHSADEKEKLIKFVVKEANHLRKMSAIASKEIDDEVGRRRHAVARKRGTTKRNATARAVRKYILSGEKCTVQEDTFTLLSQFRSDPNVIFGLLFQHTWYEEDSDTTYFGRVTSIDVEIKKKAPALTICYWKFNQLEVEGEDYDIDSVDFFTDLELGDLSFC